MVVDDVPQHWGISRGETDEFLLIGFLGAGKTTLLRRLLASPDLAQTAMLINEFGEIGLDHHLLERIDETVVLLRSGCLCCTIRGELAGAIRELQSRRERGKVPPFTRLVRESSGLADPFPVLTTLRADRVLRHHFRAGAIVTTVDAVNGQAQIRDHNETIQQIAAADQLVLTHPADHSDPKTVLSAIGGPLLFLFGAILFKHTIRGWLQLSHGAGIIVLAILAWFASGLSPLMLSILTTAIMIVVAAWESISLRSGAAEPRPEETQSEATSA